MRVGLFGFLLLAASWALAATPEDRLSTVFQSIEANRLDEAMQRVDALIREHPNFRLAHLVRRSPATSRSLMERSIASHPSRLANAT